MSVEPDRRNDLAGRIADFLIEHGLEAANLRAMAAAAGTSDRMLIYYFRDRDALMAAGLETVAARLAGLLDAAIDPTPRGYAPLLADVWEAFRTPAAWPYLRLWLEVATRAAHGTQPYATIGERIAEGFIGWAETRLDTADASTRRGEAALLLATVDGLALLRAVGHAQDAALAVGVLRPR